MAEVISNADETSEVVEIEIQAPTLTETVDLATDAPAAPEPDSEGVFTIAPFLVCVCREEYFEKAQGLGFQIIYTPYEDGYLKHTSLKHGCFIRVKEKALPTIPEGWVKPVMQGLKPDVKFLPDGKVPKSILQQVITFFKAVMKTLNNDDEAMLHVMWNKAQGYHIVVPKQTVSKASVNYDRTHMDGESMVVLDIHSHNTMGAFFSGTDNGDDRNQITVSGVFGKLNGVPETVWRLNMQGQEIKLKLEDIFSTEDSPVEVPEDWLKKVSRNATVYGSRGYGHLSGGTGHTGYSAGHGANAGGSESWATGKDFDRILATALDKAYRPIPDEKIFSPKEVAEGSQSPSPSAVEQSNLVGANQEVEQSAEEAVVEACMLVHEAIGFMKDADMDLLEILQRKD